MSSAALFAFVAAASVSLFSTGFEVGAPAEARFGNPFRAVARIVHNVTRPIARAASNVVKSVSKNIQRGVKSVVSGVKQIAKGAVKVATGVGKVVVGTVKATAKFTGGVLKGAGKLVRGDFKGALGEVKAGAKAATKDLKTVGSGLKDIASGAVDIAKGGLKVGMGLVQLSMPFINTDAVIEKVKKVIVGLLLGLVKGMMGTVGEKIIGLAGGGDFVKAIQVVRQAIEAVQTIIDVIQNPDEYLHKGREWAIDKLSDLAMKVLEPPIQKAVGLISGFAIKMVKKFITGPLAAAIGAAIAGIGIVASPLIYVAIDKLFDFAVDMIKDQIGKLAMAIPFIRNFLRGKIIGPIINGVYDKIVGALKKKFPKLAEHVTTTAERAEGVTAKPLFENSLGRVKNVLDKVSGGLAKAEGVLTTIRDEVRAAAPIKSVGLPKLSVGELVKGAAKGVVNKVKAEAKALLASAPSKILPALLPRAKPPAEVIAVVGAERVEQETTVTLSENPAEAPTIVPKAEAGADGLRTAFRAVYQFLMEDWKTGLASAKSLFAAAGSALEGDDQKAVVKGAAIFRQRIHDAFRLAYQTRVLQIRELRRSNIEESVDAVAEELAADAGKTAVLEGTLEGIGPFGEPFENAKALLHRMAQIGERYFRGSVALFTGRRKSLIKTIGQRFDRRIQEAKAGLQEVFETVNAAAQAKPEEPGDGEQQSDGEQPGDGEQPADGAAQGAGGR
jgi:hypothetical protein